MATQQFTATGLTCGHCVSAVSEELLALDGVTDVDVALGTDGGPSTVSVTAGRELADAEVAAALDEAGAYSLVRS